MNKKYLWFGIFIAILSLVAIIIGGISLSKINKSKISDYKTFENWDHSVVFCNANIWKHTGSSTPSGVSLYCSVDKTDASDVLWDGVYPDKYFD
ncbi:hypothetical protein [Spiroplasma eriocheiris]|uniref:Uncharacterized protein n=1 Tax=Spiroplasma eriocheiris TaxID=315358 RepID=A0A0H3XIG5_9MOLU|nr:hypothetical protein [Spiroplasma eriocheiris]AHF58241.1 hypothetical protein SPE_1127 [Spiroplasma eriocheiris CCTCC M 207170]AKM54678.1 hypothetical protein SERIO_v1c11250 [Spiroplasma eriocheiris]